jgi:hypothetical protein
MPMRVLPLGRPSGATGPQDQERAPLRAPDLDRRDDVPTTSARNISALSAAVRPMNLPFA